MIKSKKKSVNITLIIISLVIIFGSGIYFYIQSKSTFIKVMDTYNVGNENILIGPSNDETDNIFNVFSEVQSATSMETCKKYKGNGDFYCVTNLAIKNRAPELCDYFNNNGNVGVKNWCLAIYIGNTKDESVCALMSRDPEGDWWRNEACYNYEQVRRIK